ncbi:Stp1/IreP family PP2C-type Ser/Thr phosphatase [Pseudothauera rhizosphaerae]|nr:Stp1/IreP family PP2C-type Ser/Thr phosphatase [Pseudothauera rhizosphaerae]
MPASSLGVRWAALSDIGRQRTRNEDAFRIVPERAYAVLADGMGGHRGGDVAARIVVDTFCSEMERHFAEAAGDGDCEQGMLAAVNGANSAVLDAAARERGFLGMGATLVALVADADGLVFAGVGDSRLYRYRGGALEQLTHDHTMLQELVDGGMISAEQASKAPFRGMLTRALGVAPDVEVEVAHTDLQAGDLLLLCSDGLTDMVGDDVIAAALAGDRSLDERAAALVALANAAGGRDNVTVVLACAVN